MIAEPTAPRLDRTAALAAILTSGAMIAQQVAGKAVRDALFLTTYDVAALPSMMLAAAGVSVLAVVLTAGLLARIPPGRTVPFVFLANAALFTAERVFAQAYPRQIAVVVYLHLALFGALVTSAFWSLVNERFDPYTAKRLIGRIAGGGTLGGLLGGLGAERISAGGSLHDILPFMAVLSLLAATSSLGLRPAEPGEAASAEAPVRRAPLPISTIRALAGLPYLRSIALLVAATAVTEALVDYVFKATVAAGPLGSQESLGRFFATFYTGIALLSFVFQALLSRWFLGRLGLAGTVAMLPAGVLGAGIGYLAAPGLATVSALRAVEAVLRSSLFLSGYELFYTPLSPHEKRPAKTLIDVGLARLGNAFGSSLVVLAVAVAPVSPKGALVAAALLTSGVGLLAARRLHGAYVGALEERLLARAVTLSPDEVLDSTTRATLARTSLAGIDLRALQEGREWPGTFARRDLGESAAHRPPRPAGDLDTMLATIADLRSGDAHRVQAALEREPRPGPALVPHVLPLLADNVSFPHALRALRRVADASVGQIVDALVDPATDFVLRRRIPRVLKACTSQRAADGLLIGLRDERLEVRRRCARAVSEIVQRHPLVRVPRDTVLDLALREIEQSGADWERDLAPLAPGAARRGRGRERALASLEHVFTVLSLGLEREPLLLAYRAVGSTEPGIRGTALEYLETVLPPTVRQAIWPYLGGERERRSVTRSLDETREELLRSTESLIVDLSSIARARPDGAP